MALTRAAELTERVYTHADAHMTEEQWGAGEWHDAGGSWSGWQLYQPGDGGDAMEDPAWWRDGSPWNGRGESQGRCVWAAARTVRCPSGFGSDDGRGEKHGCCGNGFAAGSCVDDACDACGAKHVQTKPRTACNSVGSCYAKRPLQEEAEQSPEHPGAKFLAQEIEDSEDELVVGTGEDAVPFSPMDE